MISAILLFLLLLNSFFYCLYCNLCIWHREEEVKASISNKSYDQSITLIKIPSAKIKKEFLTEDDIWYKKNLYDVVKRQVIHDTVYIYMLPDKEEQNIVEKMNAYISDDISPASPGGCAINVIKNIVKVIPQPYICHSLPSYFFLNSNNTGNNEMQYSTYFITAEIITPPPKATYQI